jgi:hypothetical protein
MTMTTSVKTITDCLDDIARNATQAREAFHRKPEADARVIIEALAVKIVSDLALLSRLTKCTQESA